MSNPIEAARRERYHAAGEEVRADVDHRNPFRHDRDRLLYCSAFRRLSGVTQVVSPSGSHPTHNRLTHSLEVAQIGRSLAERLQAEEPYVGAFDALGGLDPDVVEAACLAHDLGHPPFGHVTETELNRLLTGDEPYDRQIQQDGFEGNAQSFRLVTMLSVRYPSIAGLNLTRATLSAMSKYPWLRNSDGKNPKKWGAYRSESDVLTWSRLHLDKSLIQEQTLEAQLMDWADDVAYAVHDLEDFYRAGIIPLERLVKDESERIRFMDSHVARNDDAMSARDDWESLLENLLQGFPIEPFQGSRLDRATLRSLTSTLVGRYVSAITVDPVTLSVTINTERAREVRLLKDLTWHYVIESRALISQRYGHASLIRGLFNTLIHAASTKDERRRDSDVKILPEFFREQIVESGFEDNVIARTVADCISSMSEAQAISLHNRLLGYSLGSALDPIVN